MNASRTKIKRLYKQLRSLYLRRSKDLLFHGWHHITFVRKKAIDFAMSINADLLIVEAAALTHDLNYIMKPNSKPNDGTLIREKYLLKAGFSHKEIHRIEKVVIESHTGTRKGKLSSEGKALSDADTLFKALPVTPIILAQKYISQNKVDIYKLAHKITSEQKPLIRKGIYFYTDIAKRKYLGWAKDNLKMWNNVLEALKDKDIQTMLRTAGKYGAI